MVLCAERELVAIAQKSSLQEALSSCKRRQLQGGLLPDGVAADVQARDCVRCL